MLLNPLLKVLSFALLPVGAMLAAASLCGVFPMPPGAAPFFILRRALMTLDCAAACRACAAECDKHASESDM